MFVRSTITLQGGSSDDVMSQCNSSDAMYGYTSFLGTDDTIQLSSCESGGFVFGTTSYVTPTALHRCLCV